VFLATGGCRVTGVDRSQGAIDYARRVARAFGVERTTRFVHGVLPNALQQFGNSSFDVIADRLLMSNLDRRDRATYLRGLARVLRPGGLLLLRYGIDSLTPLHATSGRVPRGLIPPGFKPFEWHDAAGGMFGAQPRRSRPVRIALYPSRFGFTQEAWFILLTLAKRAKVKPRP
jgi:SAM-dependent methyltransferase